MIRSFIQTVFGALTFIPGVYKWRASKLGSGGSYSARYCYTIWMRHIILAQKSKLNHYPDVVAELGPGDSLGVGIMALLLGSNKYIACDVVEFTSVKKNLLILEQLLEMLHNRESIPDDIEFPKVVPKLDDYSFPCEVYPDDYMRLNLLEDRVDKIRSSIISQNKMIEYNPTWTEKSIDMIISQAVLEHVDDLESTYEVQKNWLNKDGFISHSIDFKSHGYAPTWDGHWGISNWRWFLLRGNRPYMINRQPLSKHISIIEKHNFKLIKVDNYFKDSTFSIKKFKIVISENDRNISDSFIQANSIRK